MDNQKNIFDFLPLFRDLFSLTQTDLAREINKELSLGGGGFECTQSYINRIEKGANVVNPRIEEYLIYKLYYINLPNFRDVRSFAKLVSDQLKGNLNFNLSELLSKKSKVEIVNYIIKCISENSHISSNNDVCKSVLNILAEKVENVSINDNLKEYVNAQDSLSEYVDIICNDKTILNVNNLAYFVLFIAYFNIQYVVVNNIEKPYYRFEFTKLSVPVLDRLFEDDSACDLREVYNHIFLFDDWGSKSNAVKSKLCNAINVRLKYLNVLFNEFYEYYNFIPKLLRATSIANDNMTWANDMANSLEMINKLADGEDAVVEDILNETRKLLKLLDDINCYYSDIIPYVYYLYQELLSYAPNSKNVELISDKFSEKEWFKDLFFVNSNELKERISNDLNLIKERLGQNNEGDLLFDSMDRMKNIVDIYDNLSKL